MSKIKRLWIIAAAMVLVMVIFIPKVQAQQPIDIIACSSGTVTAIETSEEITLMSFEFRGISIDNLASKIFDNMNYHGAGLFAITGGKSTGYFYTKYMDPSGDFFVVEGPQVGLESNWKFLYGTRYFYTEYIDPSGDFFVAESPQVGLESNWKFLYGTRYFYTEYIDPSGDFFVAESPQVGLQYNWKFLYGKGRWKGITGGGKGVIFTKGKPISPGTSQACIKITGTYELPK